MTYDPNYPPSTLSPDLSVDQIRTNFAQFAAIFCNYDAIHGISYNHMALNDPYQGKHGAVLFETQTTEPEITQNNTVLYSQNAISAVVPLGEPQLFIQIPEFNGTEEPMQMTYSTVNTAGPIYQSFMLGGYLLFFGSTISIGTPITLSPVPTAILCAHAVTQGFFISSQPYDVGVEVTQPNIIKINSTQAIPNTEFLWMAVCSV